MATKSSRSKRGRSNQRAQIKKLQKRMDAGPLLDVESDQKLQIDAFVNEYGKGDRQFLRAEVERLARKMVIQAAYALETNAARRKKAVHALGAVRDFVDAIGRLSDLSPLEVATAFAPKDELSTPYLPPSQPWTQIGDALKRARSDHDHIRQWYGVVLERLQLIELPPGDASDILVNLFVISMDTLHKRQIGRSPPRGRSGKFVRFLEAAWNDLDFPEPSLHSLGHKAERLPQLQTSLSKHMRQ
jgi:hypothetical protein